MKNPARTDLSRERAFLVGVDLRREDDLLSIDDSLTELALLADTDWFRRGWPGYSAKKLSQS